ncbi:MAG: phosphoenolpyruvate--protein phosphotransferase [Candidatus Marinimicrobia bacterium]|nr:phosphoenolpyruvate--protein phosphotransferase [Candidatus Neomarinimicrobiota bacterium]
MKTIKGVKISPGIAIGPTFFFKRDQFPIPENRIQASNVDKEIARFQQAISKAAAELLQVRKLVLEHLDEDHAKMIDGQLMILSDPELISLVGQYVRQDNRNVVWAFFEVLSSYEKILQETDGYQKDRAVDLRDVKRRVIYHLSVDDAYLTPNLKEPAIYVSDRISPSDLIHIKDQGALGIISQIGGVDSHVGILARAFRLPYISHITNIEEVLACPEIVLDADNEEIVLNLSNENRKIYDERARQHELLNQKLLSAKLVSSSLDGVPFRVLLNIGFVQELKVIRPQSVPGIGLFRTEFLSIERNAIPNEEEQFIAYRDTLQAMKGRPVTFRTFDFGRDKLMAMLDLEVMHRDIAFEEWGGIRFCLDNPEILQTQLRAFLRASIYGPARLMLPMVTRIEDVLEVKKMIEIIKFRDRFPLGVMIETKLALDILEPLAGMVDFFSVGTNDLALYLIGVKRDEDLAKNYYHPIIFRSIHKIVQAADRFSLPVTICGEMASDPFALVGLVALGIRSVSVNYSAFHAVSDEIRNIRILETLTLKKQLLQEENAVMLYQLLREFYKNQMCAIPRK